MVPRYISDSVVLNNWGHACLGSPKRNNCSIENSGTVERVYTSEDIVYGERAGLYEQVNSFIRM